jgi:hypothetical protein
MRNMQKLSQLIFDEINRTLAIQYNKANLSVTLMPADSVLQVLSKNNYDYHTLPEKNLNNFCNLLGVDAVISGSVDFFAPSTFAYLIKPQFFPSIPDIEKAIVMVSIFDKSSAKPIWMYRDKNSAKFYDDYYKPSTIINVSNEAYLTAFLFDKAMKIIP